MSEVYSSGAWTAKEGEAEGFVEAWTEFARWLSTMPGAGTARLLPTALAVGRGTLRKMPQNLGWAIGYNSIALPIAAGVFEPSLGLELRPEIAALSMSGSSLIVAVNALMLKRLRLPGEEAEAGPEPRPPSGEPAPSPAAAG